jgi:hypothetical protein
VSRQHTGRHGFGAGRALDRLSGCARLPHYFFIRYGYHFKSPSIQYTTKRANSKQIFTRNFAKSIGLYGQTIVNKLQKHQIFPSFLPQFP